MSFAILLVFSVTVGHIQAVVPKWPPTYQMNLSTIIQPCNESGYYNDDALQQLAKFGVVSIDWSNAKQLWSNASPMDCGEKLLAQVTAIKAINPSSRTFVYRNLVKALPWFTDIREKLVDPAYSGWFLKFRDGGEPYNVAPCTNTTINGKTTIKCSMLYHDQLQTPEYPAQCHQVCDCGDNLPCGEYLFDHRNESLRQWLTDTYILNSANNSGLTNPNIDGIFIDDYWSTVQGSIQPWMPPQGFCNTYNTFGGPSEENYKCAQDIGLNANDVVNLTNGWHHSMSIAQEAILANNGFNWQLFHGVTSPKKNTTVCINWMRGEGKSLNSNNTALAYYYNTGTEILNMTQAQFEVDLAIFLLVRGPYAWIGYNWDNCHSTWTYQWFDMLDADYGKPMDETLVEIKNGVFQRRWSKCVVEFDCNQYKPSFNFTQ